MTTPANTTEEQCDILGPPDYLPSGIVKTIKQALADTDWRGTICLWLYTTGDEPCIIYQERSLTGAWAPGKLDCAAAGHHTAGEQGLDGLREAREELGVEIAPETCHFVRRRMAAVIDSRGREQRTVANLYVAEYTGRIEDMQLQPEELEGIVAVSLRSLLQVFNHSLDSFEATGRKPDGSAFTYTIVEDSFIQNYDDLQQDMARYIAAKIGLDDQYFTA